MDIFEKCYAPSLAGELKEKGVYPYFHALQSRQDVEVMMEGKRRIMLGSNNYLGLTTDPVVVEAGIKALEQYGTGIALILLDIVMPVMDGFEVLNTMNRNHRIEDIPVIMISSEDSEASVRRAYEMGVSDYVSRPFDSRVVYRRVFNTIKLYAKQRRLTTLLSEQIREREKNTTMLVGVLSQMVEFRNGESGLHVQHIQRLTERVLEKLLERPNRYHITSEMQDNIPLAAALHDIGKINIPESILNKPGKLTKEEFDTMKTHTTIGAEILDKLPFQQESDLVKTAYAICRWHHERWDGCGYPDGLKGDEIPIEAQVVGLADVYERLVSRPVDGHARTHSEVVQMICTGVCGAFNPLLLDCLQDMEVEIARAMQDTPEET